MRIVILGSGLMGPAAAYNAITDPEVKQVVVCDVSQAQLDLCAKMLSGRTGSEKLKYERLDLNDQAAAAEMLSGCDAAVAALPRPTNILGVRAALLSGTPLVELSSVPDEVLTRFAEEMETSGRMVVLGCGVEPGLTEIMAHHLAKKLDRVDECHIKCGGIPEHPAPPLGYKIVFGGKRMPLREFDSGTVIDGEMRQVPRYSGVEPVTFPGVGECEAWHEGFMPWLLDIPALQNLRAGTQKTVRWPGYAGKITVLKEMGLLSQEPVDVDGTSVIPKHLLDVVLYPKVKLDPDERDITCFRVELFGEKDGEPLSYKSEMVDRFDEATGFTSMARTTAFTGAIVARMIASGKLSPGDKPFVHPEQIIVDEQFDYLIAELEAANVRLLITNNGG